MARIFTGLKGNSRKYIKNFAEFIGTQKIQMGTLFRDNIGKLHICPFLLSYTI